MKGNAFLFSHFQHINETIPQGLRATVLQVLDGCCFNTPDSNQCIISRLLKRSISSESGVFGVHVTLGGFKKEIKRS